MLIAWRKHWDQVVVKVSGFETSGLFQGFIEMPLLGKEKKNDL